MRKRMFARRRLVRSLIGVDPVIRCGRLLGSHARAAAASVPEVCPWCPSELHKNSFTNAEHAQRLEQVERLADFGGRHDAIQFKGTHDVRQQVPRQHLEVGASLARREVVAATKGKQVPWSNSSLLGEVYLAEK